MTILEAMKQVRKVYFNEFPTDYNPMQVYGTLVLGGLDCSFNMLSDSHQIKNADTLRESLLANGNPAIVKFDETDLLDSIRILIFFENYIKGKLIVEGYEIFEINGDTYNELKPLYYIQKKEPIRFTEVHKREYFKQQTPNTEGGFYNDALKKKTINFSSIITPKYNEIINLPEDIINYLDLINEKRNNLHFIGYPFSVFSSTVSSDMKKIKEYAQKVYKELNNQIVLANGMSKHELIE